MSMIVDITPAKGFLNVRASGEFSLAEATDVTVRIFSELSRLPLRKVLLDWRQLKGEPSLVERYIFSVAASEQLLRAYDAGECRGVRFALVGEEPLIDNRRFGETVALNRSVNVMVTTNLEEALLWFEVDQNDLSMRTRPTD